MRSRAATPPSPADSQRGTVAGAMLFGCVLAAVAVGGWVWLTDRQAERESLRDAAAREAGENGQRQADKWTSRLGLFLQNGPSPGSWRTRSLACVYTHYLAPHPTKDDVVLIRQVSASEDEQIPRAVSRWLVPRFFFRAPAHLFFSNYVRTEGPISDEIEELGIECWRVHWAPRSNPDGLTERIVWFAKVGGQVIQVEDRARGGHLIRQVRRTAMDTGKWDPTDIDPATLLTIESAPPDPAVDPDQLLGRLAGQAPYDVYVPEYLPPGFVLVRSAFDVRDAAKNPTGADDGPAAPVQLLSQLYSDGVALISVGIALSRDMDMIEALSGGMTEMDSPTACPGLPADPRDIRHEGALIRMRTDSCRTVLRRDDLEGVSVTIIGRNEIAAEEYLRMMGTLTKVNRSASTVR